MLKLAIFLGASTHQQLKATIRFITLSLDTFSQNLIWGLLLKYVNQIQVWLKSGKNKKHFIWGLILIYVTGLHKKDGPHICVVRTEDEEVIDLKITAEADCVLVGVQAHVKETYEDQK